MGPMGIRSRVPESVKQIARPVVWGVSDAVTKVRGDLMPPRRLVSQVPGDFRSVGRESLSHFRDLGSLRPDQRVLDIGCGPGRMAIPLTSYLSAPGSYEGVDTWREAVAWCDANIAPRFGNFRFRVIDALTADGRAVFPYEDDSFDFAILCAISRLDKPTFSAYAREAGRVLRPGGRYFGTCLVSGDEPGDQPLCMSESDLRALLASAGLGVDALYPGSWNGHPTPLSYQDIVVATKVAQPAQ